MELIIKRRTNICPISQATANDFINAVKNGFSRNNAAWSARQRCRWMIAGHLLNR